MDRADVRKAILDPKVWAQIVGTFFSLGVGMLLVAHGHYFVGAFIAFFSVEAGYLVRDCLFNKKGTV